MATSSMAAVVFAVDVDDDDYYYVDSIDASLSSLPPSSICADLRL